MFANNTANSGGTIFCNIKSDILYDKNSNITFIKNTADNGAAMYSSQ